MKATFKSSFGVPEFAGLFTKFLFFVLGVTLVCALALVGVKRAYADITLFTIGPTKWSQGIVGQPYSFQLSASGGVTPYTWSLVNSNLPSSLNLDSSTGLISGTPTTTGSYAFTAQLQDANGDIETKDYTLSVYPSVGGFSYSVSSSGDTIVVHVKGVFGADFCNNSAAYLRIETGSRISDPAHATPGEVVDRDLFLYGLDPGTYSVKLSCRNHDGSSDNIPIEGDVTVIAIGPTKWSQGLVGQPYSLQLYASGGTVPYTWSLVNSNLPSNINLDSSTGLVSGKPTTTGSYVFTAQAQDANGSVVTKDYTLSIYPSVGGFSYSVTPSGDTITVHVKGVFGADFCNNSGAYLRIEAGSYISDPAFGTIGTVIDQDLNLYGLDPGMYLVKLSCRNHDGSSDNIPIDGNVTLFTIGPTKWSQGLVGQPYSFQLSASGGTAPYTWSLPVSSLPSSLNLDSSTGLISGTPTTTGSYAFTAQLQDANGSVQTKDYTLSVYPSVGGFSYSVTSSGDTITVHVKGVFGADFCNNSGAYLRIETASHFSDPAYGTIGTIIDQDLNLYGLDPGTYLVKLSCRNHDGSFDNIPIEGDVSVITNQLPVITPIGNQTINEGQMLTFVVVATDPNDDTLTYSALNLPSGASFDSTTHTFTWTPTYGQAGNYPNIEFTVMDNGSPMMLAFEDITITVGDVNRAPAFSSVVSQQVLEHNTLTFTVNAVDPDGDSVTLSAIGLPSGATFNSTTGMFSWTPGYSTAGIYTPTFIATDNGTPIASSSIDVVITVGSNPTPNEQAQNIINAVIDVDLPTNIENSYLANLNKVGTFIDKGNVAAAINQLNAFINKVNQDYPQGKITLVDKNNFVTLAQNLINALQ